MVIVPALLIVAVLSLVARLYKRCSSNKILVVFGNIGSDKTAKCIHGGGVFVLPLIQDYCYLLLEPMTTEIDLKGALSKKNIRVNVPATFTFGVSTNPDVMQNAAERLLELEKRDIINQANDIILGQLRLVIATLSIEEINQDREKFLEQINANVNTELNKIGLEVINVNVRDITDESGYIEAIGKKAAAEAINQAKVEVAQQERIGTVGQAEATKNQKIQVAGFDAEAVEGENTAKALIADYNADLAMKQAYALKLGEVATANAERDILIAQKEKEEAKLKKEELARQEVEKLKIQVMADAEAERLRRIALGEADAVKAKYFAEAEGIKAVLEAKALGYEKLVSVCNSKPELATSFLMIEKVESIVEKQVKAIKNIKFDKITVWDSGAGTQNGSVTANFMKDLIKSLPAMHDLAQQAGIELPVVLGKVGANRGNS
jgi:flotillin